MKIQKPTVGRIVLYCELGHDFPAIIAHVQYASVVDLCVFDGSVTQDVRAVTHDGEGGNHTWRYPPIVREEIEVDR